LFIYLKQRYTVTIRIYGGVIMKNVGKTDKIIRIILGLVLLSLVFILQGNIRFIGLLGIIPLVTAFTGYCPIYGLFHLSTNKKTKE